MEDRTPRFVVLPIWIGDDERTRKFLDKWSKRMPELTTVDSRHEIRIAVPGGRAVTVSGSGVLAVWDVMHSLTVGRQTELTVYPMGEGWGASLRSLSGNGVSPWAALEDLAKKLTGVG